MTVALVPTGFVPSPEQQRVIDHQDGHLQVVACAGAGKTEAISRRAAALVEEGVEPSQIVAFTFTDRAAEGLKTRISRRVAEVKGNDFLDRLGPMFIGTIHAYCLRLLQDHVPEFGNFDVLDENRLAGLLSREHKRLELTKLGSQHWRPIFDFLRNADVVENELLEAQQLKGTPFGDCPIGGEPDEYGPTFITQGGGDEARNGESYLDQMIRLLRMDGVRFPSNKEMTFSRLERLTGNAGGLHAEGRWTAKGDFDCDPDGQATVAVAFGPQYGPVTAKQVEDLIRTTNRRGYDHLVIAGFSFDGPAQAIIEEAQHPRLRIHIAHIRPDVNPGMAGLLKEQPGSQLFTVFGQPRTKLKGPNKNVEYTVVMEGVDIYDPVTNTIRSTEDQKVAAWFLDSDYDGRTFCMTQAFFPDKSAWEKLSKALGGLIDPDRFEALSGTVSLPFPAGKHRSVAVKVIDPRGNEVMQVHQLV